MRALNLDRISGVAHYATSLLDHVIPLRNASHADVVKYIVDTPMRYAECFGVLMCGRKISLINSRQFVGWSSHDAKRALLFRNREVQLEIRVDPDNPDSCESPGYVHDIVLEPAHDKVGDECSKRKFIAIDGSMLVLPQA